MAASAATRRVPRILNSPHRVRPGERAVVVGLVRRNAACRLSLRSTHRLVAHSRALRSRTGELEWSWSVPRRVAAGSYRAIVGCAHQRRTARAAITALDHRHGRAPLARRIRALAVRATEPSSIRGLGGGAYPRYGAVMVPGGAWFGGHGVDVISNGYADNLTGQWQCVELVERFIRAEHFGPAIWGNANELYANASAAYYDHHPNGSGYVPVPGDIVVLGAGTRFGHVAIVDQVVGGTVYIVEQNASASGRNALSLSGSTLGREYGMGVIGVLHARANDTVPVPLPPPGQSGPIGELGFIKLRNTGSGSVEAHWDSVHNGRFTRAADLASDFSPVDAANGVWQLFGAANGAPELGFIKLRNTPGTVEVHWDTVQAGRYRRAGDFTSDFSPVDAANGAWDLFDATNGVPLLGFVKVRNTGSGTVEAHWDTLQGGAYRRAGAFTSDFSPADADNGAWQLFGWANGAPELGFIKLRNTPGTVEVHWDVLQGGRYRRAGDFVSDFSAADAGAGSWVLYGTTNGVPQLGFVKSANTPGTIEGHADALHGTAYARTADYPSDFGLADAGNGVWQIGVF